ncbi:hypothetical protein Agub_g11901, partial [Astrephomene gubernaculifera]
LMLCGMASSKVTSALEQIEETLALATAVDAASLSGTFDGSGTASGDGALNPSPVAVTSGTAAGRPATPVLPFSPGAASTASGPAAAAAGGGLTSPTLPGSTASETPRLLLHSSTRPQTPLGGALGTTPAAAAAAGGGAAGFLASFRLSRRPPRTSEPNSRHQAAHGGGGEGSPDAAAAAHHHHSHHPHHPLMTSPRTPASQAESLAATIARFTGPQLTSLLSMRSNAGGGGGGGPVSSSDPHSTSGGGGMEPQRRGTLAAVGAAAAFMRQLQPPRKPLRRCMSARQLMCTIKGGGSGGSGNALSRTLVVRQSPGTQDGMGGGEGAGRAGAGPGLFPEAGRGFGASAAGLGSSGQLNATALPAVGLFDPRKGASRDDVSGPAAGAKQAEGGAEGGMPATTSAIAPPAVAAAPPTMRSAFALYQLQQPTEGAPAVDLTSVYECLAALLPPAQIPPPSATATCVAAAAMHADASSTAQQPAHEASAGTEAHQPAASSSHSSMQSGASSASPGMTTATLAGERLHVAMRPMTAAAVLPASASAEGCTVAGGTAIDDVTSAAVDPSCEMRVIRLEGVGHWLTEEEAAMMSFASGASIAAGGATLAAPSEASLPTGCSCCGGGTDGDVECEGDGIPRVLSCILEAPLLEEASSSQELSSPEAASAADLRRPSLSSVFSMHAAAARSVSNLPAELGQLSDSFGEAKVEMEGDQNRPNVEAETDVEAEVEAEVRQVDSEAMRSAGPMEASGDVFAGTDSEKGDAGVRPGDGEASGKAVGLIPLPALPPHQQQSLEGDADDVAGVGPAEVGPAGEQQPLQGLLYAPPQPQHQPQPECQAAGVRPGLQRRTTPVLFPAPHADRPASPHPASVKDATVVAGCTTEVVAADAAEPPEAEAVLAPRISFAPDDDEVQPEPDLGFRSVDLGDDDEGLMKGAGATAEAEAAGDDAQGDEDADVASAAAAGGGSDPVLGLAATLRGFGSTVLVLSRPDSRYEEEEGGGRGGEQPGAVGQPGGGSGGGGRRGSAGAYNYSRGGSCSLGGVRGQTFGSVVSLASLAPPGSGGGGGGGSSSSGGSTPRRQLSASLMRNCEEPPPRRRMMSSTPSVGVAAAAGEVESNDERGSEDRKDEGEGEGEEDVLEATVGGFGRTVADAAEYDADGEDEGSPRMPSPPPAPLVPPPAPPPPAHLRLQLPTSNGGVNVAAAAAAAAAASSSGRWAVASRRRINPEPPPAVPSASQARRRAALSPASERRSSCGGSSSIPECITIAADEA